VTVHYDGYRSLTVNKAYPQLNHFLEHVLIFQSFNNLWLNDLFDMTSIAFKYQNLFVLLFMRLLSLFDFLPLDRHLSEVFFGGVLYCIGSCKACNLDVSRNKIFLAMKTNIWMFESFIFMIQYCFVQVVHEVRLSRVGLLSVFYNFLNWKLLVLLKIQRYTFLRRGLIMPKQLIIIRSNYTLSRYLNNLVFEKLLYVEYLTVKVPLQAEYAWIVKNTKSYILCVSLSGW